MKLVFAVAALVISAPAAAQQMTAKLVTFPNKGDVTTVATGGELYSYSRLYTAEGATLDAPVMAGDWLLEQTVPTGTNLVRVESSKPFKACVPAPLSLDAKGPCFIDDNGDGIFDRQSSDEVTMFRRIKGGAPYTKKPVSMMSDDSFKYVILYQGATSDTFRFSYREFKNDMARPAFTEELTVPREAFPSMVRLKDRTFEITGLSGMGLSYRLMN